MMRLLIFVLAVAGAGFASAEDRPMISFEISLGEKISCGKAQSVRPGHEPRFIEAPLLIHVHNRSRDKRVLGQINVLQERIYHRSRNGKLILVRTSPVPDDYDMSRTPQDAFEDVVDRELSPNSIATVEATRVVYVVSGDSQKLKDQRALIISFHLTNLHHNGSVERYWSDPMTIMIPDRCGLD